MWPTNIRNPIRSLMVYSLTHRRLRPGNLPTTRGVLVLDAAAAMAIGNGACSRADADGAGRRCTIIAIGIRIFCEFRSGRRSNTY